MFEFPSCTEEYCQGSPGGGFVAQRNSDSCGDQGYMPEQQTTCGRWQESGSWCQVAAGRGLGRAEESIVRCRENAGGTHLMGHGGCSRACGVGLSYTVTFGSHGCAENGQPRRTKPCEVKGYNAEDTTLSGKMVRRQIGKLAFLFIPSQDPPVSRGSTTHQSFSFALCWVAMMPKGVGSLSVIRPNLDICKAIGHRTKFPHFLIYKCNSV